MKIRELLEQSKTQHRKHCLDIQWCSATAFGIIEVVDLLLFFSLEELLNNTNTLIAVVTSPMKSEHEVVSMVIPYVEVEELRKASVGVERTDIFEEGLHDDSSHKA